MQRGLEQGGCGEAFGIQEAQPRESSSHAGQSQWASNRVLWSGASARPLTDGMSPQGTDEQGPEAPAIKQVYTVFSKRQVLTIVAFASWSASFSGLSSNIYFPSITGIAKDLAVTPELVNLTITIYLVFQGLSPSLWAPLSDSKGRRTILLITFSIYFGANIGLAVTKSYAQLAVLRALQSSASASSVAIGAAIVGDVVERRDRAGYMGAFSAASLLATAVGPIIGGAMSESLGWRSIFWFLAAFGGIFWFSAWIFLPETLRKLVANGSIAPRRLARAPAYRLWIPKETEQASRANRARPSGEASFTFSHILRPVLLLRVSSVMFSSSYVSMHYAIWQMSITTSSTLYAERYGLNELQVGLTFIANGSGCIAGTLGAGRLLDWTYRQAQMTGLWCSSSDADDHPVDIGRARLGTAWMFSLIESTAVLVFGWTIDRHVSLAVPVIATFFIAVGLFALQTAVQTFLVDAFPENAASASATLNLLRCLMAAAGTSGISSMVNAMGAGWAFTLLSFMMIASNVMVLCQLQGSKAETQSM